MSEELGYRPCVGVMLVNADGKVFVGRRIDNKEGDWWQMPQGGVDPGEDLRDAALRELWEETGVTSDLVEVEAVTPDWITYDLPPELLGKVWKGRFRGQKQLWYLLRFNGPDDAITIETEHPEFSRWQWMDPDALIRSIVPFKRTVYETVLATFRKEL